MRGLRMPDAIRIEEHEDRMERVALEAVGEFQACAEWAVIEKLPGDILCPGSPTICKKTAKLMQKRAVAVKSTR